MFTRIKKNKGYYGLLLADTSYGSATLAMTLALVNLPLALIVTGLNIGANIIGGFIMGPKGAPAAQPVVFSASAMRAPKQSLPQRGKNFAKSMYSYSRSTFKDPNFVVGSAAAGAGINIFFQAVFGIAFLGVMSPLAMAGCAALAGAALICIFAGNIEKWKGLSKFYSAAFHKGAHHEAPGTSKNFLEKIAERPRLRKIFNSPITRGLKKLLMIGMSAESSIFTIVAASTVIVTHVAAIAAAPVVLPALAAGVIPILLALKWGSGPVWHLVSAGKLIIGDFLHRKPKSAPVKKITAPAVVPAPLPVPAPVAVAAIGALSAKPLTVTFDKTAGRDAGMNFSPKSGANKSQVPGNAFCI